MTGDPAKDREKAHAVVAASIRIAKAGYGERFGSAAAGAFLCDLAGCVAITGQQREAMAS
ncbi:MAG: hypothetical protein Q7J42_09445 [Sulfuritalea sp.]|nr:hypothetical protein [Sulfuritalea sp.]